MCRGPDLFRQQRAWFGLRPARMKSAPRPVARHGSPFKSRGCSPPDIATPATVATLATVDRAGPAARRHHAPGAAGRWLSANWISLPSPARAGKHSAALMLAARPRCRRAARERPVLMALARTIENRVEDAYRRGELMTKRALLMQRWATFATNPARPGRSRAFAQGGLAGSSSVFSSALWLLMNLARRFRIRALSVRATVARLEVVARRNPGKAPEIIASIRRLERLALFAERYATGISKREQQSGSGSVPPVR